METMGFLGPPGTHSEAAALYLRDAEKLALDLKPYPDIYSVMQAVIDGELDHCFVPVENSLEGSINITLDMLAHGDELAIERELIWGVHNHLMAKCRLAEIKTIYSHAQPLAQCREYLKANFPDVQLIAASSTARAAERAAACDPQEGCAAICTERGGELNGLKLLVRDIQDNDTNCTRFYQICRKQKIMPVRQTSGKTLLICQIDGKRAGSLCEMLQEFAVRKVNMTRIESRPARTGLGEYIFFFDLETDCPRDDLAAAIEAVRQRSVWHRHCGEFPVIYANNI